MLTFLTFIFYAIVFVSLVLPWINNNTINKLQDQIIQLHRRIAILEGTAPSSETASLSPEDITPVPPTFYSPELPWTETAPITPTTTDQKSGGFEQLFGGKAFVWMGGLALALSGFFMVKYSIETGLLSPSVRTVLGLLFGVGLLIAGNFVRSQPRFANGPRIAQSLSGAGLADLYAGLFAATTLYDLIPPVMGLASMACVTACAVILSLRHGMPIAILGLVGGFLTPALVNAPHLSTPLLFLYLYAVLAGLVVLIHKRGWWQLSIPAVTGAFIWVISRLFTSPSTSDDSLYLGLFLLALSATIAATSKATPATSEPHDGATPRSSLLDYITMAGSLFAMALITFHNGFGFTEWSLFGLLSLGGIALATFKQDLYGPVPCIAMGTTIVMLAMWHPNAPEDFAVVLSLFAALFIASAYLLQWRSTNPLLWAGQLATASLGYYFIGFSNLRHAPFIDALPHFWGVLALALCTASTSALQQIMKKVPNDHVQKPKLTALYASLATAFLSLGLCIEVDADFLAVALAGEVLGLAWISTRLDIPALRQITTAVACAYGYVLLPHLFQLAKIASFGLIGGQHHAQALIPSLNNPAFHFGVPTVCFGIASYLFRKRQDDNIVRAFEAATVALFCLTSYHLIRQAFHPAEIIFITNAGFFERGVITNSFFISALACLYLGRKYNRTTLSSSGLVLTGLAIFRLCFYDLFIYNPLLFPSQTVGELPILNALLLTFGAPIVWTKIASNEMARLGKTDWSQRANIFALVLAFALVSLDVRQFFHGAQLNGPMEGFAEIYTYSIVWLVLGIGFLYLGSLRQDAMLRKASLLVMLLTVGKVCLYDASALTGLWRVLSFAGLGFSLLGLSWFYARFVFKPNNKTEGSAP